MTSPGSRRFRSAGAVGELVANARQVQPSAVARLVSLAEGNSPLLREVAVALAPHAGRAQVVGITGSPGVGKSTTISALTHAIREKDRTVGVLSVDPSSPYTGGALLGDRIRMMDHSVDKGVFVRSLASRGRLGGLSAAVPQALRILDASGYDVVLIETVGAGQAEVEIASLADTTLVVLAPGAGDGVQAVKAGILEIADILVVNKDDRAGSASVARDLERMRSYRSGANGAWAVPVVRTIAANGGGIDALLSAVDAHSAWLRSSGALAVRRRRRASAEVEAIVIDRVLARFSPSATPAALDALADSVADGSTDPYSAADRLFPFLTAPWPRLISGPGFAPSPPLRRRPPGRGSARPG
jgi:LAO/AO transport system kinase